MSEFIKIAKVGDIPLNSGKVVFARDEYLAIFNVEGKFFAIDNSCPHRGGPLGEGDLDGTKVTCPWHSWQFDVVTGACTDIPDEKIKTYSCKVEGDEVFVDI